MSREILPAFIVIKKIPLIRPDLQFDSKVADSNKMEAVTFFKHSEGA